MYCRYRSSRNKAWMWWRRLWCLHCHGLMLWSNYKEITVRIIFLQQVMSYSFYLIWVTVSGKPNKCCRQCKWAVAEIYTYANLQMLEVTSPFLYTKRLEPYLFHPIPPTKHIMEPSRSIPSLQSNKIWNNSILRGKHWGGTIPFHSTWIRQPNNPKKTVGHIAMEIDSAVHSPLIHSVFFQLKHDMHLQTVACMHFLTCGV